MMLTRRCRVIMCLYSSNQKIANPGVQGQFAEYTTVLHFAIKALHKSREQLFRGPTTPATVCCTDNTVNRLSNPRFFNIEIH